MDIGHWEFQHEFDSTEWYGFIYRITELDTGREYIGKKQFTKLRRKTIKNRKNKKHIRSESDWREYTGSSTELNDAITAKGKSNYKFEILSLHKTKGSLHYAEVQQQISEDVLRALLPSGQRKYFNKAISSVKFLPPVEHSEETRLRIQKTMLELYADKKTHWMHKLTEKELEEWLDKTLSKNQWQNKYTTPKEKEQWIKDNLVGENNPMYGVEPFNKGKTFEEVYGVERAAIIKKKLSEAFHYSGENHWGYGKSRPKEVREKISKANKGKRVGKANAMYGKPCHYKMTKEEKEQWKKNVGNSIRGLKRSDETRKRMSESRKGKKLSTITCPYCQKTGGKGNMMRYHFDNCKNKLT